MQKTQTAKKYKTVTYLTRHLRADLLKALKRAAAESGDTAEGALNRVLAIGIPLFLDTLKEKEKETAYNGGRTKRRQDKPRSIETAKSLD